MEKYIKYNELLEKPEYEFMNDNKIQKGLLYLCLGGSISYGTNTPESDTDIRGIMMNPACEIIGRTADTGQVEDRATDTVIYTLQKAFKLFSECNPNTIEMLNVNPEHIIHMTKHGKRVLSIKDFFLSKLAIPKFGGFARQQMSKLEHAVLANGGEVDKRLAMCKVALEHSMDCFKIEHAKYDMNFEFNEMMDEITGEKTLGLTMNIKDVPLRAVKQSLAVITNIYNDYTNVYKEFSKKKIDGRLSKHMMHTYRLLTSGAELASTGKFNTYRGGDEHDLLMKIRRGDYLTADGKNVIPEFWDLVHEAQEKFDYAAKHTVLKDEYNKEIVEGTLMEIQLDYLTGKFDTTEI